MESHPLLGKMPILTLSVAFTSENHILGRNGTKWNEDDALLFREMQLLERFHIIYALS